MTIKTQIVAWIGLCLMSVAGDGVAADAFPVEIKVDAGTVTGKQSDAWRFFGADEPNYATMKDGRALLTSLGSLKKGQVYFRTHNLLSSGDGTPALKWGSTNAYTEDANGKPVYDWHIIDGIFDTYLARGIKPYVEIGFMPKALASSDLPYQHQWRPGFDYKQIMGSWASAPKDYDKWEELVYQWVRHAIDRYGRAEVETWYWETWNEANIIPYWTGTREDFFKLHDISVRAIRRALPTARVGGPDMAGSGGGFLEAYMDHVTQAGTPTDFLSFHAKGSPKFIEGHVRMGIAAQLKTVSQGFETIAANPAFRDKPIVIGESDPEGCAACQGPQFGYRNGTVYSSYTAASFARIYELADLHKVRLEGVLTWAFEFEDQPYFAGFRQLSSNGLDLPVLNVFRLYAKMGPERLKASSDHQIPLERMIAEGAGRDPDVGIMASRSEKAITMMVWHYHDDDVAGPDARINIDLSNLPPAFAKGAKVVQYRVDKDHANSYAAWKAIGSPIAPTYEQYLAVKDKGELKTLGSPEPLNVAARAARVSFVLPRQGVALVVITPE